jgi:hypothetical protein
MKPTAHDTLNGMPVANSANTPSITANGTLSGSAQTIVVLLLT